MKEPLTWQDGFGGLKGPILQFGTKIMAFFIALTSRKPILPLL